MVKNMTLEEFYHTEKILLDQFYAIHKNNAEKATVIKHDETSFDWTDWEILFHYFITTTTQPQLDSTHLRSIKLKDETTQP